MITMTITNSALQTSFTHNSHPIGKFLDLSAHLGQLLHHDRDTVTFFHPEFFCIRDDRLSAGQGRSHTENRKFIQSPKITTWEPFTTDAATIKKAAEERSPGTCTSRPCSTAGPFTETARPCSSTSTPRNLRS